MFEYGKQELALIDEVLEPKLAWAKDRTAETEQLALDATRLMSCTSDRLEQYADRGFFKRCWYTLSGKTGELERANEKDLIDMQKVAWRYLNLLNERDLMLADSILTVKNNLLTLTVDQVELRNEIARMAERIQERFLNLEERMKNVEVATSIHSWLFTLDTRDFDERFTPYFRLLSVVRDFNRLKEGDWNLQELLYLQKGLKVTGLPWKQPVSIAEFVEGLVDEIDQVGIKPYSELIMLRDNGAFIPGSFILENIAAPGYLSLFELNDSFPKGQGAIEELQDSLSMPKKEAVKKVMLSFVKAQGIDLEIQIPLRDLAVELLHCIRLTQKLYAAGKEPVQESGPSIQCSKPGDIDRQILLARFDELVEEIDFRHCRRHTAAFLSCLKKIYEELSFIGSEEWEIMVDDENLENFDGEVQAKRVNDYLKQKHIDSEVINETINRTLLEIYDSLDIFAEMLSRRLNVDYFYMRHLEKQWETVLDDDAEWDSTVDCVLTDGFELMMSKARHEYLKLKGRRESVLGRWWNGEPWGEILFDEDNDEVLFAAYDKWLRTLDDYLKNIDTWCKNMEKHLHELFTLWFKHARCRLQNLSETEPIEAFLRYLEKQLDDLKDAVGDGEGGEEKEV